MKKRYALVRVDNLCPMAVEEKFSCIRKTCKKCEDNYGDTKEQLIRKINQAIFRVLDNYYGKGKDFDLKILGKEIVEFLGVEE